MANSITTVRVALESREDGGLRVHSDKLVGLVLSGPQPAAVLAKIAPAIEALFKHKGLNVEVWPERPLHELLNGPMPKNVDMSVCEQVYIVQVLKAA